VYLHPKPPCDNGIVSPLFIEVVIESTIKDKVCMQLPHHYLHASSQRCSQADGH
jgi:hypothetical protein